MVETPPGQDGGQTAHWRDVLVNGGWFVSLPADLKLQILDRVVLRRYDAGQVICRQGEKPEGLYGIISGALHTVGTSTDGSEVLLSVIQAGEWTGFAGMLDNQATSFALIAGTPVEIVFLPRAAVKELFFQNMERLRTLVLPLIELIRFSYRFLSNTNGRAPSHLVAQRLIDLSHCVYVPDVPLSTDLNSVNQDDMAAATYLTRPTVNRVLQKMAKDNIVRLGYGRIEILDIPALHALTTVEAKASVEPKPQKRAVTPTTSGRRHIPPKRLEEILMMGRWFSWLPPDIREEILPQLEIRRLAAGEYLYTQGQQMEGMYVALSGQLKTFAIAPDGRRTLLALIHPGDWTGFVPPLDGRPEPLCCVATSLSQVAILPGKVAKQIFEASPARYPYLYTPPIITLRQIYSYLINTNGKDPTRLIARRLYDLALTPYQLADAPRKFLDNLSQTDIAEATGLSRPSVNKVLKDFAGKGLVEAGYGRIKLLDPDKLLAVAEGLAT